jgi:hypothetical protein
MSKYERLLLATMTAATAMQALLNALRWDTGEEAGGQFTGPLIIAAFLSVPILLASAILRFKSARIALTLCIFGGALTLPLATWALMPGWWCTLASCAAKHPSLVFDWGSIILIFLLTVSLLGQIKWARR